MDENLTWEKHAEYIIQKVACNISILHKVAPILSLDNKIAIYRSIIEPYFNYCCLVWDGLSETLSNKLQRYNWLAIYSAIYRDTQAIRMVFTIRNAESTKSNYDVQNR